MNAKPGEREAVDDKIYTAFELCGDWWWTNDYRAVPVGGRVEYWEAYSNGTMKTVRLTRIGQNDNSLLRTVVRYVDPDTPMRLVPQRS